MPDDSMAARIRRLEIKTRLAVDEIASGSYRSVFRGQGIEFDTVRPYQESDDARSIDWMVTARTGSPHVKTFVEERELTVMLAVDVSRSLAFGTGEVTKRDAACEIASLLALAAGRSGDKVGLLTFASREERYLPPRRGRNHALRLINLLLHDAPAAGGGTDLAAALDRITGHLKKRGVVFILSDLLSDTGYADQLKRLAKRHDVIVLRLTEKSDREWRCPLPMLAEDAETGALVKVPGAGRQSAAEEIAAEQLALCRSARVEVVEIDTAGDPLQPVLRFFAERKKRLMRGMKR